MSYFLKSGKTYRVTTKQAMDLHELLPAGNYVIKQDQAGNLYLEEIDGFTHNGKRYGDLTKNTERIFNTFMSRHAATGVMLAGEKGSGKSLLAKSISMHAATVGIPTLVINTPWCGDKFNAFLQDIDQPIVVLFDEFEKVYDKDQQEMILTLLDGVFPSKKLFMLTCNDKWKVDSHMRNRPGRIFYMIDFTGLNVAFIQEYCEDNLINKSHIPKVCDITSIFNQFNFDMLKALVEEMNRYNEDPVTALLLLNVKPEYETEQNTFDLELVINNTQVPVDKMEKTQHTCNPIKATFYVGHYRPATANERKSSDNDGEEVYETASFIPTDLKKVDGKNGVYVYVNNASQMVTLKKVVSKQINYYGAF